jgi:hypothetical protein
MEKIGPNPRLKSLEVKYEDDHGWHQVELNPTFDRVTCTYHGSVPSSVKRVLVHVKTKDPEAKVDRRIKLTHAYYDLGEGPYYDLDKRFKKYIPIIVKRGIQSYTYVIFIKRG